jgi:hypothetical protein
MSEEPENFMRRLLIRNRRLRYGCIQYGFSPIAENIRGTTGMLIKGDTSETITLRNDRLYQRRRYQGKALAMATHPTLITEGWHCTQRNGKKVGKETKKEEQ